MTSYKDDKQDLARLCVWATGVVKAALAKDGSSNCPFGTARLGELHKRLTDLAQTPPTPDQVDKDLLERSKPGVWEPPPGSNVFDPERVMRDHVERQARREVVKVEGEVLEQIREKLDLDGLQAQIDALCKLTDLRHEGQAAIPKRLERIEVFLGLEQEGDGIPKPFGRWQGKLAVLEHKATSVDKSLASLEKQHEQLRAEVEMNQANLRTTLERHVFRRFNAIDQVLSRLVGTHNFDATKGPIEWEPGDLK